MRDYVLRFFRKKHQRIRWIVQAIFFIIVIRIGFQFSEFVRLLESGILPNFDRPPGVEAFLPISALVSLKHFFLTGVINDIHPSALVILLIVFGTALFIKKGFCAWVCPIGAVSEMLHRLQLRMFRRKIALIRPLDTLLRGLKYLVAAFFIWSIFFKMSGDSIAQFIQSPYHMFADVKMLTFFTRISMTAMIVLIILTVLSFFVQHFWCRYLCPYGALLGLMSFLSTGSIKRDPSCCTECGKCEKVCPGRIRIRQLETVKSSECMACMACVDHCPEEKAIGFSFVSGRIPGGATAAAMILCLLFTGGVYTAKATGHWQNRIPKSQYLRYVVQTSMPWNSRGEVDPVKMEKMMTIMKNLQIQRSKMLQSNGPG